MKKWYKIEIYEDGNRRGYELVKAESEAEAKEAACEEWGLEPGEGEAKATFLDFDDERTCNERDEIERFMEDGCTKQEAVKYIATGSCSVPAAEWDEWAKDNAYLNDDGEPVTLTELKANGRGDGVDWVTVNGEEYILLYVL